MSEGSKSEDAAPGTLDGGALPAVDAKGGPEVGARKPDPLHGVTLAMMLEKLVDKYGWPGMAKRIRINCFASEPSMASSLTFLRRTPWAREKLQDLYLYAFHGVMKPPSAWTLRGREMRGGKGRPDSKNQPRDSANPRREVKTAQKPSEQTARKPLADKPTKTQGTQRKAEPHQPTHAPSPLKTPLQPEPQKASTLPEPQKAPPEKAPPALPLPEKPAAKKPAPKSPRNPHY